MCVHITMSHCDAFGIKFMFHCGAIAQTTELDLLCFGEFFQ